LFCKNIGNIYEGLFEESKHYVGFNDDLSDFGEKVDYYLKNDAERERIALNGYNMAKQKHTWKNRVNSIYQILNKELKK
jgi:spore maturation protein CgeB